MGRFCYQSFRLFDPTLVFSSAVLFNPPPSCIIDDRSMENKQQVELKRGGWKLLEAPAHPHEAKLLGAHFFGLLRGKKGAPRVASLENIAYLPLVP
jgi:hypothetical protein